MDEISTCPITNKHRRSRVDSESAAAFVSIYSSSSLLYDFLFLSLAPPTPCLIVVNLSHSQSVISFRMFL